MNVYIKCILLQSLILKTSKNQMSEFAVLLALSRVTIAPAFHQKGKTKIKAKSCLSP